MQGSTTASGAQAADRLARSSSLPQLWQAEPPGARAHAEKAIKALQRLISEEATEAQMTTAEQAKEPTHEHAD